MGLFSGIVSRVRGIFSAKRKPPEQVRPGQAESGAIRRQVDKYSKERRRGDELKDAREDARLKETRRIWEEAFKKKEPVTFESDPLEDLYETGRKPGPYEGEIRRQADKLVRKRNDRAQAYEDMVIRNTLAREPFEWMYEAGPNPPSVLGRKAVDRPDIIRKPPRTRPTITEEPVPRSFSQKLADGLNGVLMWKKPNAPEVIVIPKKPAAKQADSKAVDVEVAVKPGKPLLGRPAVGKSTVEDVAEGFNDGYKAHAQYFTRRAQQRGAQKLPRLQPVLLLAPGPRPAAGQILLDDPLRNRLLLESKTPREVLRKIYGNYGLSQAEADLDLHLVKPMASSPNEVFLHRFADHIYRKTDGRIVFPHFANYLGGQRSLSERRAKLKDELGFSPGMGADELKGAQKAFSNVNSRLEAEHEGLWKRFRNERLTEKQNRDLDALFAFKDAVYNERHPPNASDVLVHGEYNPRIIPPSSRGAANAPQVSGQQAAGVPRLSSAPGERVVPVLPVAEKRQADETGGKPKSRPVYRKPGRPEKGVIYK